MSAMKLILILVLLGGIFGLGVAYQRGSFDRHVNSDQLQGKWRQFEGEAKIRWGKLTDDDWRIAEGNAEKLAGRIQERYGNTKAEAYREIDELFKAID